MTYPSPFGTGGGTGFSVGAPNNIFGATSGNAEAIPLLVTPAASRAAAQAVRDAYATANPSWLAGYDANEGIGIFLFWTSSGDNLMVGQTRIGGQWVDQISVTGVQGVPGSGTDFSNITPNHIPAIGAGPDFVPYDSGLRVIPNTFATGAPSTVATPGSLQVGVATLRLEDQFEISGGGETLNFHASARDQWYTPVMNQLTASGNARAIGIEQAAPITANIQPVFDTTLTNPDFELTASGGGGLAAYDGEIVHAFFAKTPAAQSNIKLEFFLQGQTSPFWSQIYGSWPAGDFTITVESPVGLYLGQTYRVRVSSTSGGNVQMLGNSSGVPFLSATLRPSLQVFMAQTNDFPWVDQVLTGDVAITATNWPDYKGVRFVNNSATNRTVTVTAAGMPALADLGFRVTGTGTITFTPADQIDGAASRVFSQGETNSVRYSGSTWNAEVRVTAAGMGGISYTGTTPASQELIVGTGSATTAQRSGITLVGGRIPNTSIGVNSVQLTGAVNLNNQNDWQTYRFRRIQFTGSGNYVRGIQTLPELGRGFSWLQVGDWVEVMNIGGTGNYNCQIQTANVGQTMTGNLTGSGPTIPVSQTAVYRITYTGNNTNWLVSAGASGTDGESVGTVPYTPWLPQDDGAGIYTANDVEIRAGMQLLTQQYSVVGSATSINLNTCEFTFTEHVGAAQFFKYLSADTAFPFVTINQQVPSMDATAALAYLDGTVLNTSYALGKTIQPDGTGVLTQISYVSAGIMQCRLVMTDVTNLAIGAQLRISSAINPLNNGDFVIQGFTDFSGYTIVQYANANASTDLNAGDTLTTVAVAAPVLFWRVTQAAQGSSWIARCQFGLNSTFTILAELDNNWFTPGLGHVSWLDDVYQQVVSGEGGSLHTDADIHATGTVRGAGGMILASRTLADNVAPTANGDSIYYDINTAVWRPGAPRVCQLPVPQTLLTSANQWQVLTFDGTNMSMQFPRFAGVPTSRLDALQNGDSVRYDSTAQTWYNSRTQGSCFSRRQSVGQSVPSSTDVRVSFDTGDSAQGFNSGDVGLTYDSTTNIGRFTNTSGRRIMLQVNFQVAWSGGYTNGIRFAWIRWNGSLGNRIGYSAIGPVPVTNEITVNNGSGIVGLDANQFFEVWCYQSTGVTLTTGAAGSGADAGYANRIQITRLNP